jgi:hypothetical protein
MKSLLYFLALSVSIFFTACSSNDQDIMPLSPQFEKVESKDGTTPYSYLQAFNEIKNIKVEYFQDKEGITLIINSSLASVKHLYAVVEQTGKQTSSLIFLGNSGEGKYLIKGYKSDTIKNIRIYGVNNSNTQDGIAPFSPSTIINKVPVKGWSATDSFIKVSSTKFPAGVKYLFTELKTKQGNVIVFLGKPVAEDFEIPKYGQMGIIELNLFAYTPKFSDN